ncbi:MAG: glycosyltransferase [Sediminibacterium sp.]
MNPLISVVIPSYNHAHFLTRALASLQEQEYKNWEAIIIDNHSEDNTDDIVKQFADPRVSLIKIHNNGIIAASRNKGIAAAKGEWIAFLDSDDWWTPAKLQTVIKMMNDQTDLFYHDLAIVRETPSVLERDKVKSRQLQKPVFIDLLVNDNAISNSSVVVRKKLLNQIGLLDENPEMAGAEDYNAWLRIARITDNLIYIPEFLGFYQVHAQGISRKDMTVCYRKAIEIFLPELDMAQRNRIEATLFYMRGKHLYQHKNYVDARKALRSAIKLGGMGIRIKSLCLLIIILLTARSGN